MVDETRMVLLVEMEGVGRFIEELRTGFCGDGVRLCSVVGPVVTICVVVVVVVVVSSMASEKID